MSRITQSQQQSIHLNNSSLTINQSNIRISISQLYQIITIKQKFPSQFKSNIWIEITKLKPTQFLSQQQQLLYYLLNQQQIFNSHFKLFYHNHLRIYEWFILASQKHFQIKDYLFSKLLKKTILQYKLILKDNINTSNKNMSKKQHNTYSPIYFLRSSNHSPNQISKQNKFNKQNRFNKQNKLNKQKIKFNKQIKKAQSLPNSIHQSTIYSNSNKDSIQSQWNYQPIKLLNNESNKQNVNFNFNLINKQSKLGQDYHQLFVKTLDACDGSKYIHYDFCKHQKGYENRGMYNNYIRLKKRKISNTKQSTLYQSLTNSSLFSQHNKQNNLYPNHYQRSNVFHKTFSFLKNNNNKQYNPNNLFYNNNQSSKLSRFQLMSFNNQNSISLNNFDNKLKKNILRNKSSKTLVLKRMPHQFGKQKPLSAFIIKVQKPSSQSLPQRN